MTLALGAMIATTSISPASANAGTQESAIQAINIQEQSSNNDAMTPLNPGVTIPLIKQTSILDRLSSVTAQLEVIADPSVKLSFERPSVTSTPAPPDPAILAKKKADEEAKVAAEKAAEEAKVAKVAAEAAAAVAAATPAPTTAKKTAGQASAPAAPVSSLPQNLSAYQQYAAQEMSSRGLNGTAELTCLIPLWHHESGWNPNAANPSSTARGIPQMMMNIHYGANWQTSAAGVAYLTNPEVQIDKGLDYIMGRYGSPCRAWGVWQAQSWY